MSPYSPPRQSTRLPVLFEIEVVAKETRERLTGWTGNVSRGGCYVRTPKPFGVFTAVRLRLLKGNESFEAQGSVVHSTPEQGMGIAFEDVPAAQQALLDSWLAGA